MPRRTSVAAFLLLGVRVLLKSNMLRFAPEEQNVVPEEQNVAPEEQNVAPEEQNVYSCSPTPHIALLRSAMSVEPEL